MKRKVFRRAVRDLAVFCSKQKLALQLAQVEAADRRDATHQAHCVADLARELSAISDEALAAATECLDDRPDTLAAHASHAARAARLAHLAAKELRRLTRASLRVGGGR